MNKQPIDEFILGGYYLVQPSKILHESCNLIPKIFYSQSNCVSTIHPELCGYSWTSVSFEDRKKYANDLDLNETEYKCFQKTLDSLFDKKLIGWSNTFYDISIARDFCHNFLKNITDVKLFTIGLKVSEIERFKIENSDCVGILSALEKNIIIPVSYNFWGFEILGHEWNSFHSFACHDLNGDYKDELKIDINNYGLIDDYGNAVKAANYTNLKSTGAEPVYWQPWAIIECEL